MYGIDRKQIIIAVVLLGAILFGTGYKAAQLKLGAEVKTVVPVRAENKEKKENARNITVYVSGAVKKPGVYTFAEGARIIEGINKAQPSSDAAMEYINLAEPMSDGQQIAVPRKNEVAQNTGTQQIGTNGVLKGSISGTGKINLNTAGLEDLDSLPGIGPSTAQKIIEYRKTNGRFKSVSDLLNISGIGEKKLAKFKDKVTI